VNLAELRVWWVHRPLQRLSPQLHRELRSLVLRRRLIRLRRPATFTEKLTWRCLHDRRDLLAMTCDKLAAKDWSRLHGGPELRIPPVLWAGTDVGELLRVDLPARWVLKPNHGSGRVHFGQGPVRPQDLARLRRDTRGWLREHLASAEGEWGYSRARRCLLVEEQLPGQAPLTEYKFFMFAGRPHAVLVHTDRFGCHSRTMYSPDWQRLNARFHVPPGPALPEGPQTEAPAELPTMLRLARRLSAPFDFVRVDLYAADGSVWFGELTSYPTGGWGLLRPESFDLELGRAWRLPSRAEAGG
jgi:TupA-like ATPgrasp